ncbi:murein biosynthesis integral membrane protein MurJ [Bacillus cereus]|uniref:murein biosynthesis integral membrane protein MurJ n=1 Tax=Bacillus cereus TaxID=1396 RepID=UPI000BF8BCE0|nr:murein biosynthesis integral membrane protein MurJ [Bacillus cereus]PFA18430.1 murein biosynthesis integral membrane protein MurJ [Bacillus cereus]
MKKTVILLMLITILSKLLGFGRDLTLSYFFGVSNITDAYFISNTIPTTVFGFIGTGIAVGFIPIYQEIVNKDTQERALKFTSNLLSFSLLFSTVIILLGFLYTENLVNVFASGFDKKTHEIAIVLTKINLFSIYFTSAIYIFSGFLNVNKNFITTAIRSIPLNIIIILFIIISYISKNVYFLAYGGIIGMFSQLILMYPHVRKLGFKFSFNLNRKDKYLKKIIILSLPIIIGVSINQINILVDRTMASQIESGGISSLTYANIVYLFIEGIIVTTIITVVFPSMSNAIEKKDIDSFKNLFSKLVIYVLIFIIPISAGTLIFSKQVILLLFGRGAFNMEAIEMTSNVLSYYAIGMVGFVLREVISRAFYAFKDTKSVLYNAGLALILNIILNIILSRYMGISGLALATSISGFVASILLGIRLQSKIKGLWNKHLVKTLLKILIATIIMAIAVKGIFYNLTNLVGESGALLISILLGAIIYAILLIFMKLKEVNDLLVNLKMKLLKR